MNFVVKTLKEEENGGHEGVKNVLNRPLRKEAKEGRGEGEKIGKEGERDTGTEKENHSLKCPEEGLIKHRACTQ